MKAVWKYFGVAALALAVVFGASYAQEKSGKSKPTVAEFYIATNDQVITLLQSPKGEKAGDAKIETTIRKLKSANEKLRALDTKLRDPKQSSQYGKLVIEAIEIQGALNNAVNESMAYRYPAYITTPIDGMIPIENFPVEPPDFPTTPGDCEQAGNAVKNDCMIAAEMLEDCGAIDAAAKTVKQFSCATAGQSEETACKLAISTGGQHFPRETTDRLAAEITCRNIEEQRGVGQPGQTQTSTGN